MSFCTQQQESFRGERFLWSARLSAQLYNSFSGLPAVALHARPAARFVNYDVLDIFFVAAEVISSGRHNRVSFFLHCFEYSFPLFKRNVMRHNKLVMVFVIHSLHDSRSVRECSWNVRICAERIPCRVWRVLAPVQFITQIRTVNPCVGYCRS